MAHDDDDDDAAYAKYLALRRRVDYDEDEEGAVRVWDGASTACQSTCAGRASPA